MKSRALMLLFLSLTLGWMLLIFMLSAQEAPQSDATSYSLARYLLSLSPFHHTSDYEARLSSVNQIMRTLAHFSEYFILGVLFTLQALFYVKDRKKRCLFSTLVCLLYCVSDEVHQLFVPGRAFELIDIAVDTLGSVSGLLLTELLCRFRMKKRQH